MAGLIFIGVFGFVGILLWIIALVLVLQARAGVRGGVPVQGEVYDHSEYIDRGQTMYCPLFRAQIDGAMVIGTGQTATNWKRPRVGTRVNLVFVRGAEVPLRERGIPTGILIASIILFVMGLGMFGSVAIGAIGLMMAPDPSSSPSHDHADRPVHPRRHGSSP
jgi:hypothetical protein